MSFLPPATFNLAHHLLGARIDDGSGHRRALICDEGSYTYAEVQERANRLANLLSEGGVRPEERVLLAQPDGLDMVASIFAVLALGAVVVMVNPELGDDEVGYFLEYTRARAAVIHASSSFVNAHERPQSHLLAVVVTGTEATEHNLAAASPAFECFPTHRDDPAIWLFSGGTTGRPKAVVQSHRSFANTTELYAKRTIGYGPADVTLSVPKLYFGYATGSNLFFPFAVGATSILFGQRCSVEAILERITLHRPTILINVPTMVGKLVASAAARTQDWSSLRVCTSAGEALPPALHRAWTELTGVELLDGLGTAEMWHVFVTNRPGEVRPGTLGRAVDGFDVRVRDDDGNDLPVGEVGWMWVRGDSRAQQYWQQAEKSHEAFRGAWYVSGDMLRVDEDGYFHYCGRGDDMLKVSGKWLAPTEVEDCLRLHPEVAEVAVVGMANAEGLTKPVAFVVPATAGEAGSDLEARLHAWARDRLEPYKVPRKVIVLEKLPLTHLGKVDRGKLRRDHSLGE